MNLNKKLSKKVTAISFVCIALFVSYVSYVAYGMQKTVNLYRSITAGSASL